MCKHFLCCAAVTLALSAALCIAQTTKATTRTSADGWVLEVSADDQVPVDQPIFLTLTLANSGLAEPVTAAHPLLNYHIDVTYEGKTKCRPTSYGEGAHITAGMHVSRVTLNSGDQIMGMLHLNRIFDMTNTGNYRVTITRKMSPRDGKGDPTELVAETSVKVILSKPLPLASVKRHPTSAPTGSSQHGRG
jgi:hypothetical protein